MGDYGVLESSWTLNNRGIKGESVTLRSFVKSQYKGQFGTGFLSGH